MIKNQKNARMQAGSGIRRIIALIAICMITLISSTNISGVEEPGALPVFIGAKVTLKEKIDQYQKIPVFIVPSELGIKSSGLSGGAGIAAKCPANSEKIDIPKEYEEVLPLIITALNKGFGTSAFTAANYDEIPTRKATVLGAEVDVQDWPNYEHKFILYCNLSVNYDNERKGEGASVTIKGNLTCSVRLQFWDVVNERLKSVGNVMGYSIGSAKSAKYTIEHCFSMSEFTAKEEPNSLVQTLNQSLEGGLVKFTEKQMKKYDKAMKKKK